ncbi:MAG: hypothetical protein Q4G48_03095 [Bacteroidia bacterium]|nr:hypothetical protein [Bacteroidia bacterium]
MRKAKILLLLMAALLLGCASDNLDLEEEAPNQVLMLKVDYETNTFEGGTEFKFPTQTTSFTIENEYVPPGDFGSVKLIYKELGESLFFGTIHWMGTGEMTFPEKLEPAHSFKHVDTYDLRYPSGYEDVFNPDNRELDYKKAWLSVQGLVKAREYLAANPNQKAKMFLYTPSVGAGNPKDWYWVIYMKK